MLRWLRGRKPPELAAGMEHHRAGRLREAAAVYHAILARDPDHVDALHFAGVAAYQLGQHAEAARLIGAALARRPDNAPAHNNLGNVLSAQGRLDEAIAAYRRATEIDRGYVDAFVNLGARLKQQGRLDEAAQAYRQALAIAPRHAVALSNLGAIRNEQGRLEEALECCRTAVALRPDFAEALNNLGNALLGLGRRAEAVANFRKALDIDPQLAAARLNIAAHALLHGDYAEGLPLLEDRFDPSVSSAARLGLRDLHAELEDYPQWRGEGEGEVLLVWTDQGLGDSLMCMRYLLLLKPRFERVLVYCEKALARSMKALPGVDVVLTKDDAVPYGAFDLHCPMMSLPLAFDTRVETIPRTFPYYPLAEAAQAHWASRLAALPGRRVGLAWGGNPLNPTDARRTIRLAAVAPVLAAPGVSFVSLQKGPPAQELRDGGWPIVDWMEECHDLVDTAALIAGLDLVIGADTAMVHLAGALGRPVWMLLKHDSEWRWMLEREDSVWYPSMRIFRQLEPGNWSEPLARVARELAGSG
ncbi:MAG: tetratricopeptide repeat protein [Betaproteobacteria bacterium]